MPIEDWEISVLDDEILIYGDSQTSPIYVVPAISVDNLKICQDWVDDHNSLVANLQLCETSFQEIKKGMGPFAQDQQTFADNTIEAMKGLAQAALDLVFP